MAAYIFAEMDVHDPKGYAEYPPRVMPLIQKHGGRVTHRIGRFEDWEGDVKAKRMVIIQFPDLDSAKAFWSDPEYPAVKEIRLRSATSRIFVGQSE